MKYDCIIIGAGIAGLTCGIRCAEAGLNCAIISGGMSALHFASGSIDLLGRFPEDSIVKSPFDQLPDFITAHTEHPYAKTGKTVIHNSLVYFADQLKRQSITLCRNDRQNHFHLTTYGTLTPTYLSQQSVYSPDLDKAFFSSREMALISFEGFRDFHIPLIQANLPKQSLFQKRPVKTGIIELSSLITSGKNPHEFRSIDISRMFETENMLQVIADRMKGIAGNADLIGVPACIGFIQHNAVYQQLLEMTGKPVYEIPTLPPSILGMRLDHALKSRFSELGGVLISGDKVIDGQKENGRLSAVITRNHKANPLEADYFVLASGSFFSGGLISESTGMYEPILNLLLEYKKERKTWAGNLFFQPESHAFLGFGVKTTPHLNPFDQTGRVIENLYCAGAILAGYNPIREGSGGGVAISSGYHAAGQIIAATVSTGAEPA